MKQLTLCASYGRVVYYAQIARAAGSTAEECLANWRAVSPGLLKDGKVEALVQDVYLQPIGKTSDMMDAFFGDFCLATSMELPEDRREVALRCLRSSYITTEACASRHTNLTEAQVQGYFGTIDYAKPLAEPIVSRVFAGPEPSQEGEADLFVDEWFRCFNDAE